jgi:uncharacterized protein YbbK (DUF523 family)
MFNKNIPHVFKSGELSFLIPDQWKECLGEDVLSYSKSIRSRLDELKISRRNFLDCLKAICPEFVEWYSPKKESELVSIERYGVPVATMSEETKQKIRHTNRLKYGADSPLQNIEVEEKRRATVRARYGVDNVFQLKSTQKKSTETLNRNYGVSHPMQSKEIRQKCLESVTKAHELNKIRINTINGRINSSATQDKFSRFISTKRPFDILGIEFSKESTVSNYNKLHELFLFEQLRELDYEPLAGELEKVSSLPTKDLMGKSIRVKHILCGNETEVHFLPSGLSQCKFCTKGHTLLERQLINEFKGFDIYPADRSLGFEIDILFKSMLIGFELNGAFTHNSGYVPYSGATPKPKNFHAEKTIKAAEHGIRLYHLWEDWGKDKIISIMKAKLSLFDKTFYARKLTVKFYGQKDERVSAFLAKNHVKGPCSFVFAACLVDNDTIIQCITFRRKGQDLEIARNATLLNSQVVGGFSRLFKHSVERIRRYFPFCTKIITFADRDLTPIAGNSVYLRNGFEFIGNTGLTLSYFVSRRIQGCPEFIKGTVVPRQVFQKQNLAKIFANCETFKYDDSLTEQQMLFDLGIYPVYNSGCWKYIYVMKQERIFTTNEMFR